MKNRLKIMNIVGARPNAKTPGNKQFGLTQIPKVVGGLNPPSGRDETLRLHTVLSWARLGGHCIPVDPYLSWKAREYNFATRFIELASEVNTAMPYHVAEATANALNDRKKSMKGSKILLLGVAYKKDVDDLRESPRSKSCSFSFSAARSSITTIHTSPGFTGCAITTTLPRGQRKAGHRHAQRHTPRHAPPRKK